MRYPEWAAGVLEVTGPAELERGATFEQRTKTPLGKVTTAFVVDELDELREIRLRCTAGGFYSHWLLTAAQGGTFTDVEIGMDPTSAAYRAFDAVLGKRRSRQLAEESLDALKRFAHREHVQAGAPSDRS